MAIFGGRNRNVLQQITASGWKSPEEREELLGKLRDMSLKTSDSIPLLWHGDSAVRSISVKAFMEKADVNATTQLAEGLMSQPSHIRAFGMRIFPQLKDEVVSKVINSLLEDRNTQKNRLAWDIALNLKGETGAQYLERAISSAPQGIQVTAMQRLVKIRRPDQIYGMLEEAAKGDNDRIAAIALEALISMPAEQRVVDLMINRVAHGDATSRQMATAYLRNAADKEPERMRTAMLELLSEGEDATRRVAVEILLETGNPQDVILQILVFAKELVGWLRDRILDTLRTFGDDVLKPAVALLQHEDDNIRTTALVLVEQFNDPRLVGPVCRLLTDEDWWMRISACDTLGRLKDERAVPHLVKALANEEVRWAAIDALAQIGSSKALKPLAQLLRDKRKEVRTEVVRAFGHFTHLQLLPLLKQVNEKDPSSEVRTLAAEVYRDMSTRLNLKTGNIEQNTMAVSSDSLANPLDRLLARIREDGASDLHIVPGDVPFWRHKGVLVRIPDHEVLLPETSREWVLSVLNEHQTKTFLGGGEVDFCYAIPEVGRYRANAFVQRLGTCATFRVIPNVPPTFSGLRLPGRLTELLDFHQGLILVSGPAASGKSTTLAAIVNLINESKSTHIITLEDPIEFVHPTKTALINQREQGTTTVSFARALRGALRQDPDVIMVGEMRDLETISMSLEASETGHLVIATLHTTSAVATIERLISSFPPDEQGQIRMSLSESLKYVVCQSLLPRKDGQGRVACFEVLKGTFNIGNLIRENKLHLVPSLMQIGRNHGMQTVDMALEDLVEADLISPEVAWGRAEKQATFEPMCDPKFIAEAKSLL
jgi:twitching motility protein PilT